MAILPDWLGDGGFVAVVSNPPVGVTSLVYAPYPPGVSSLSYVVAAHYPPSVINLSYSQE